jgi:hypothetical protein
MKLANADKLAEHRPTCGTGRPRGPTKHCRSCGKEFPRSEFRNGCRDCRFLPVATEIERTGASTPRRLRFSLSGKP